MSLLSFKLKNKTKNYKAQTTKTDNAKRLINRFTAYLNAPANAAFIRQNNIFPH